MEEQMKEMFGDIFQVEYDRDSADYVYEREKLAALSGKKASRQTQSYQPIQKITTSGLMRN